jgi:acyl carrier protein
MTDRVREFVLRTLTEAMNLEIDVDAVGDDRTLGPEGLDLESLAFVELMAHLELEFDLKFEDDELEELSQLTLGEFCRSIAERAAPSVVKAE